MPYCEKDVGTLTWDGLLCYIVGCFLETYDLGIGLWYFTAEWFDILYCKTVLGTFCRAAVGIEFYCQTVVGIVRSDGSGYFTVG